ncbi:hypothetical protein AX16_004270 [Volvariella volvacea WC 439]|nr:hypothetical protein AX16_004270 [Volvariella volvacea WC 439]
MQYVAENTSIPMPVALDAVWGPYGVFILMTTLPGEPFGENHFLSDLSPGDQVAFEDTMRDWLGQLRSLPAPAPEAIASFDGSRCRSVRVLEALDFGPFPDEADFNSFVLSVVPAAHREGLLTKPDSLGLSKTRHRLCFTHADLHPNNLHFENGRLTGITDWECAGWYPEYWEYTSIMYQREVYTPWWDMFRRMFPQYERELELEREFWKVYSPW